MSNFIESDELNEIKTIQDDDNSILSNEDDILELLKIKERSLKYFLCPDQC